MEVWIRGRSRWALPTSLSICHVRRKGEWLTVGGHTCLRDVTSDVEQEKAEGRGEGLNVPRQLVKTARTTHPVHGNRENEAAVGKVLGTVTTAPKDM